MVAQLSKSGSILRIPIRRQATVFPYRGKYRVQYLDTFGRQRTKTVETKSMAHRFLAEVEGNARNGHLNLASKNTPVFSAWLEYWVRSRQLELSPATIWGYQSHINNYLIPALGNIRVDQVTAAQIAGLYRYLQVDEKLSPGTVRKVHSLLSSCFKMALDQGLISHSPMEKLTAPKYSPKIREVFTETEVERLLSLASERPPKAYLRWLLALRYGLRQGEVLGLKIADFDLQNRTLTISRTVNSLPGRGVVELPTKTRGSTRTIPIDSEVAGLVSVLDQQTAWIFQAQRNSTMPVDATCDSRSWKRLLRDANVRELPLHCARHTAATLFIKHNINPRAVQMLLGHSSVAYTLGSYVHPGQQELRNALESSVLNRGGVKHELGG